MSTVIFPRSLVITKTQPEPRQYSDIDIHFDETCNRIELINDRGRDAGPAPLQYPILTSIKSNTLYTVFDFVKDKATMDLEKQKRIQKNETKRLNKIAKLARRA